MQIWQRSYQWNRKPNVDHQHSSQLNEFWSCVPRKTLPRHSLKSFAAESTWYNSSRMSSLFFRIFNSQLKKCDTTTHTHTQEAFFLLISTFGNKLIFMQPCNIIKVRASYFISNGCEYMITSSNNTCNVEKIIFFGYFIFISNWARKLLKLKEPKIMVINEIVKTFR